MDSDFIIKEKATFMFEIKCFQIPNLLKRLSNMHYNTGVSHPSLSVLIALGSLLTQLIIDDLATRTNGTYEDRQCNVY